METDFIEDEFEYPFESYAGYEYDCGMRNPYDEWEESASCRGYEAFT